MTNSEKLLAHCEKLQLPVMGIAYLKRALNSPPSRRVKNSGSNVICKFPSRKMGVTIQCESHRHELVAVHELEHDPAVLGFLDQPEPIKISYISAGGWSTSPTITPDYLVIYETSIKWIEVKPDAALAELENEMPHRYIRSNDGVWHCPPAEATAETYGFRYKIWTPSQVDATWFRNIQFLAEYFGAELNAVPAESRDQIKEATKSRLGLSIQELRDSCELATVDYINILIAQEELYIDFAAAPLAQPEKVKVFVSQAAAETHKFLTEKEPNGPSESDNANSVAVPPLSSETLQLITNASPDDLTVAVHRYRILTDPNFAKANPVPQRTRRYWHRSFLIAKERYCHGLLGLIPRYRDRGNRVAHFPDKLLELVDGVIEKVYCTPTRPNKLHAFNRLQLECQQSGFLAPSYRWFTKRIATRPKFDVTLAREGKRAAHKFELIRPEASDNHGEYPWQACLTDHTLTDVELVCSETGENFGRAWLSVLLDGFSRRILAFYLTFDPPSYRTLMMLIRRCVERHGRLPRTLIIDGGKEFRSIYFETLTAAYEIITKQRPGGKPRYGSLIERMFGTVNTQFLHTLKGNTQNMRNVRQVTKSINPKNHAVFCLEEMHSMLGTFLFEIYDNRPHPSFNLSPNEKYKKGIETFGERAHRSVANDQTFYLMTLPAPGKGTAKIQPGMGIKINGFYFWASEMRSHNYEGSSVRVRFDPQNFAVAWAYLGNQWIQCRANGILGLEGRTEKEMQLATLEWRRSRKLLGLRQTSSHLALAEFLKTSEAANALRIQQAKDRALKRIESGCNESKSDTSVPPSNYPGLSEPNVPADAENPGLPAFTPTEDYGDL